MKIDKCGNCTFLKIIPASRERGICEHNPYDLTWFDTKEEYRCLVKGLWTVDFRRGDLRAKNGSPLRHDKCLELTKNILAQFKE